eukprot:960140_1
MKHIMYLVARNTRDIQMHIPVDIKKDGVKHINVFVKPKNMDSFYMIKKLEMCGLPVTGDVFPFPIPAKDAYKPVKKVQYVTLQDAYKPVQFNVKLKKGSAVEVYSKSKDKWMTGHIIKIKNGLICVAYGPG